MLKKHCLVLAAGLTVSCFLNPQPEPPGSNASAPAAGGAYNVGAGGAGYDVGIGGSYIPSSAQNGLGGMSAGWAGATGTMPASGGRPDKADADAGANDLDAGPEPGAAAEPAD